MTVPAHHAWNFISFYFLLLIICTEIFSSTFHHITNLPKFFISNSFEIDSMEPSKRYSFILLLFILKWYKNDSVKN